MILRILFSALLFLLSINLHAKIYITYVNGAEVDDKGALDQQVKFKESMTRNGVTGTDLVFLPRTVGQPTIESFQIVPCQAILARLAFPDKNQIPSYFQYDYYFELLGKIYSEKIEQCAVGFKYSSQLLARTLGLANQILDTLNRGHTIVLVPYSQGNFYVEAALAWLRFNGKISNFDRIRVVNVGNIAPTSLNGFNVTSTGDSVVSGFPHHFPQIYIPCFDFCSSVATQLERDLRDPIGHFLALTYLNESAKTFQTKTSFPAVIAELINRAISELSPKRAIKIRFDYVGSIAQKQTLWKVLLAFFIPGDAHAQSVSSLEISINSSYIVRVEGVGFDGQEGVSIEGSICDLSTRQNYSGYFTQRCLSGNVANGSLKIRVFDTNNNRDILVPIQYQTMELRGPTLTPNAPTLTDFGSGTVRISWGAVSGATGYQVVRDGIQITTLGTTTEFVDAGRTQGAQVCYRIRAVSGITASSNSPEACVTPAAAQCQNTWTGGFSALGVQESTTQSCPVGQSGTLTSRHTCGSSGIWGAISQTGTCTTIAVAPASCTNSWNPGSTAIGGVETGPLSCPSGQVGSITDTHSCGAGGLWGATTRSSSCATPAPTTCSKQWSSGTVSIGETESTSLSCPSGQVGSIVDTHACQAGGSWGATSRSNSCTTPAPLTCPGTWTSGTYAIGQVEDKYANSCPAGSNGQVRSFHTCQASGQWGATANSDNCTPTLVVPSSLYTANVASGVQLTWNPVSGATSYIVYRGGSQIATPTTNSFVDSGVSSGGNYCYQIASYSTYSNPASQSSASSQVCQTYQSSAVTANPPSNVSASQVSSPQKGIRLTWSIPSGSPDAFQVFRYGLGSALATIAGTDSSFTDWSALNLTTGVSYCYYLKSIKGSVKSLDSSTVCSYAP